MDSMPIGEPISEAEALQRLQQRLDPSLRYYAAWWLGRTRSIHPQAVPLLIAALQETIDTPSDPEALYVARNAARALGKLKAAEAVSTLLQGLDHHDHDLREACSRSLGETGATQALGALRQRLERPGAGCAAQQHGARLQEPCEALLEAIGTLARGRPDQDLCAALLPWSQHGRPQIRSAACRALLQISGETRWGETMLELLQDPEPLVRRGALLDLGATGWRPAAGAIVACRVENSLKLLALRQLLEHPLGSPAPTTVGPGEQELLQLMDGVL